MSMSEPHVHFYTARPGHNYLQSDSFGITVIGSDVRFCLKERRYHLGKIALRWPRGQVHGDPAEQSEGRERS